MRTRLVSDVEQYFMLCKWCFGAVFVWSSGSGGGDIMNKRWSNKYGGMDYYLHSTFENIRSLSMSM